MITAINLDQSEFDIYTEESVQKKVPESAGIYLLWAKQAKGDWDCIHVGHATNIKRNLLQHLSPDETDKYIRSKVQRSICGYEWALVSSEV